MFTNGLKHSGILLLVTLLISVAIGFLTNSEIGVLAGYLAVLMGAIYFGYTYYPRYESKRGQVLPFALVRVLGVETGTKGDRFTSPNGVGPT